MLACELLDGGETPLDLLLACCVNIERLAVVLQVPGRFAHVDRSLLERRQQRCELAVETGEGAQRLQCAAERGVRAHALILVELGERGLGAGGEPAAVGEPGVFLGERIDFTRLQPQRRQLLHLVAQQLEPRVAVACLAVELERAIEQPEPDTVRDAHLADERGELAVAVEQLALRGTSGQGLKFVLAVDVDEDVAGLAQQLHRYRLPVQIGARAAVGADDPAHGELAGGVQRLLLEPLPQLARRLAELEGAADFSALAAVAHHLRAGTAAGEQLQRVHQDRLAGAGLAGEHREPGAQLELHGIDDGEVADLQVGQHDFSARSCRGPSEASSAAACSSRVPAGAAASRARRRW